MITEGLPNSVPSAAHAEILTKATLLSIRQTHRKQFRHQPFVSNSPFLISSWSVLFGYLLLEPPVSTTTTPAGRHTLGSHAAVLKHLEPLPSAVPAAPGLPQRPRAAAGARLRVPRPQRPVSAPRSAEGPCSAGTTTPARSRSRALCEAPERSGARAASACEPVREQQENVELNASYTQPALSKGTIKKTDTSHRTRVHLQTGDVCGCQRGWFCCNNQTRQRSKQAAAVPRAGGGCSGSERGSVTPGCRNTVLVTRPYEPIRTLSQQRRIPTRMENVTGG